MKKTLHVFEPEAGDNLRLEAKVKLVKQGLSLYKLVIKVFLKQDTPFTGTSFNTQTSVNHRILWVSKKSDGSCVKHEGFSFLKEKTKTIRPNGKKKRKLYENISYQSVDNVSINESTIAIDFSLTSPLSSKPLIFNETFNLKDLML